MAVWFASIYNEENQILSMVMSHSLFPIRFGLKLQLKRIASPGIYSFVFVDGLLQGLKGEMEIKSLPNKNHCVFFAYGQWLGVPTGFSDLILKVFSETASHLAFRSLKNFVLQ